MNGYWAWGFGEMVLKGETEIVVERRVTGPLDLPQILHMEIIFFYC
jgi:hypothetical protein